MRDSPGGRNAACTGPTPAGVENTAESPGTFTCSRLPAFAGAFWLATNAKEVVCGSPGGPVMGTATGRKISPQPTANTARTSTTIRLAPPLQPLHHTRGIFTQYSAALIEVTAIVEGNRGRALMPASPAPPAGTTGLHPVDERRHVGRP